MTKQINNFNGFFPETLNFLNELKQNNNKVWFEAHKHDYEKYLLNPFRNLVVDLSEFMLFIDFQMETKPAINKTISRIYRDIRFSKDKSLFRNTMWFTFKKPIEKQIRT